MKKLLTSGFFALALVLMTACQPQDQKATETKEASSVVQESKAKDSSAKEEAAAKYTFGDQNIMSSAWMETSSEHDALCYQIYNLAHTSLDAKLKDRKEGDKKPAIVLDIDDTVLDNAPYQAYNALFNSDFPKGWHEWVLAAIAKPIPGSVEFLKYAKEKGCDIYYISDRDQATELDATIKNLSDLGFPDADAKHIMLKVKGEHGKEPRRVKVREDHDIIMLFGDNILDFEDFADKSIVGKKKQVKEKSDLYGKTFFALPNPLYGGWEGSIYNGNFKLSNDEKSKARKAVLHYFNPETNKIEGKVFDLDAGK